MAIEYTVYPEDERWMTYEGKRTATDKLCDGCGERYGTERQDASNPRVWWLVGNRWVTVITDRSGSEYATAHLDRPECVEAAIYNVGGE